ncbi:hypothetical protein ACV3Z6_01310 [Clostridium perfringens]|uniref:hypothetical protein n=1 Tax=Clostridium perfringens TaxID=1502 RepID=UPI001A2E8E94|nr:hypothetical protein [Clostridium perfringens]EHK2365380.1 hypothetical protein [Clostridium perfringens]MCX0382843.1 hypothetical protein [Clostridium perfringens]MCX0385145.1 hypothetical protein [Clostridium perfringens]MDK0759884.1 hypothetical protein [Clostridium perfringens]MDU7843680.1 hypothetical protein [Clostridium perfringens]
MRDNNIKEILEETKVNIDEIRSKYLDAIKDDSIKEALRVKVKNCLENLRSCLDYMACDIYEKYYSLNSKKIYFPYGKKPQNFRANLGNNFKKFKDKNGDVYALVESVQPYKCNDTWLVDLCNLTNINKHDNLSSQRREDYHRYNIQGIGLFQMNNQGTVIMRNNIVNGIPQGSDIVIKGKDILTDGKINLDIIRIDWVEFKFENTNIDVLKLLNKAYKEIFKLSKKIYEIIK